MWVGSSTGFGRDGERFVPNGPTQWREWLQANHATSDGVWLVYWKKASGKRSLSWSEAVDEALCFGWIDSKVSPIDEFKYEQWFTTRKARSVWSKVNQDKVEVLRSAKKMTAAGEAAIEIAKQNGSWKTLEVAFDGTAPPEVLAALDADGEATRANFESFPPGWRRILLEQLAMAKQDVTKAKRINEIVACARANQRGPIRKPKPTIG
jgi:uncharacterized protein YdeI (YjbR/CyaY-like superfamily)